MPLVRRATAAVLLSSALPLASAGAIALPPPSAAPQKISAETDPFLKALAEREGTARSEERR